MILELDELTHRYDGEPAVEDVSFGVEQGELVALLGQRAKFVSAVRT